MTFTKERKRKPPIAIPHLNTPIGVEQEGFTRAEVAEIFNNAIDGSQVSRIQSVLVSIEPYQLIDRDGVWGVYVFLCWRQMKTFRDGTRHAWRRHFQEEFEQMGEESFLEKYVYKPGGSRAKCDRMVDEYLLRKNVKKFA